VGEGADSKEDGKLRETKVKRDAVKRQKQFADNLELRRRLEGPAAMSQRVGASK